MAEFESPALAALQNTFGDKLRGVSWHNDRRVYVKIAAVDFCEIGMFLYENHNGRLATLSGVDTRSGIELLYHFMIADEHLMLTLRILLKKPQPETISFGRILPAADWAEREVREFLGVKFIDHPDPRRFVLPDDWPDGVYPLRRGFDMAAYKREYEKKQGT